MPSPKTPGIPTTRWPSSFTTWPDDAAQLGAPVIQAGDPRARWDAIAGGLAHLRGRGVPTDHDVRVDLLAEDLNFLLGRIVRDAVDHG